MTVRPLWLDLGDLGAFANAGPLERWQDHGLGLLRTILQRAGVATDLASTRAVRDWPELAPLLRNRDVLLMNVRSYTFPFARRAAEMFKALNPAGVVVTGGLHPAVAPQEMEAVAAFDVICRGAGEGIIVDLARDPRAFPRLVASGAGVTADWPAIDRTLWPDPGRADFPWPLEPACGWGPSPVATVLTSRVCPWRCAFCNEASYVPAVARRSVLAVIDELNHIDRAHGPLGSVVIHDSMFFQHPAWLEEWLDAYPRRARRRWPYWAAARADTVRRWPELFEALVRETGWSTISIGFESGSDRVLDLLNKECSTADNDFAIDLLNRIGDDFVRRGQAPPRFWANVMLAIPGETREDAFATMRQLRRMRYAIPSIAFYSPYPGSALGYQLAAEGCSRLTPDSYHRYPSDEKLIGIDYAFYRDLLAGRYDAELEARRDDRRPAAAPASSARRRPHRMFLFETTSGRRKLAWGPSPAAALAILATRLDAAQMARIRADRWAEIHQRDLHRWVGELD